MRMETRKIDAYEFAQEYPQTRYWGESLAKGNAKGLIAIIEKEFDDYEQDKAEILENLPDLKERSAENSKRLQEIHKDLSQGPKKQEYDPTKSFSPDERETFASDLETLGIGGTSIVEPGIVRVKRIEIYVHQNSLRERSLGDKWGKYLGLTFAASVVAGIFVGVGLLNWKIGEDFTEGRNAAFLIGGVIALYGGGCLACFSGKYLGEKYGHRLGGNIPLSYFHKNPFKRVSNEMITRTQYIEDKLGK